MEVVRIYDLNNAPDVVQLFDEYRQDYKQLSDI